MTNSQREPQASRGRWRSIEVWITRLEVTIGALSLITILLMVFLQALQRYFPGDGFAWTGELARFSLIWLTFAAAGVLVSTNGHIALEIMDAVPNQMVVRWVQVFALLVVAATGVGLAVEALALIDSQQIIKSPVLRVPMSVVYIPVLIGVASMTIRALVAAVLVARNGPMLTEYDGDDGPGVLS
ncbi:TRAP transporter small permease subunit [Arthrobacter sp. zg-Y820]|uniref:TRAP transporter small permease n=1 Tax=unclassified Arthrobacter TaxID=235627 RepID=UPI002540D1FB|nr:MULTISPECIES: TRAP transporter small permease subunit [unclassified Arthrobacter]MCC9195248.1 TRAP transporter small permease [Arthrobacter sp. zg-Y820]MDK1278107.1 TRAP transporter small permease subunit [Arthrobacter sp. zg.Y820]MDK1361416.1 TRAP transporter small permease subunit [Arthrobacter sp. zg-Y1219]WIB09997.1 TRAP transporter small permease subunit [Arthrobacter sp. zg-Y820]